MTPKIEKAWFADFKIFVRFDNGQEGNADISRFPNLRKGSPEQMNKFELWDNGKWIHWEELDEDLSAEGFWKEATGIA